MDPATEAALVAVEADVKGRVNFKSDAQFRVSEKVAQGGQVTVEIKVKTKHGFSVTYTASEAEVQAQPAQVGAQLSALADEELRSRYAAIRPIYQALKGVIKDDA